MGVAGLIALEDFPGATAGLDPGADLPGALVSQDLVHAERGAVRQRPGFKRVLSGLAAPIVSIGCWSRADGTQRLLVQDNTGQVKAYDPNAAYALKGSVSLSTQPMRVCAAGTATTEYLYISDLAGLGVQRYDGAAFSTFGGSPQARDLCVTVDGRLCALGMSNRSRVLLSEALQPEVWATGAGGWWFDLHPGDGEEAICCCTWGGRTFVFKQSAFWTFGTPGKDERGSPVWTPKEQRGVGSRSGSNCVSTPLGVFFMGIDGVYLTTGGPPEKVSGALDAIFSPGKVQAGTASRLGALYSVTLAWHADTLLVKTLDGLWAYWPKTGRWSRWNVQREGTPKTLQVALGAMKASGNGPSGLFATNPRAVGGGETNDVFRLHEPLQAYEDIVGGDPVLEGPPIARDEPATAIASEWRSGWHELDGVTTIRRTRIVGYGTVKVQVNTDERDGPEETVTLEADFNNPPKEAWAIQANRGRRVQLVLKGANAAATGPGWSVERVEHHVSRSRRPDADTTA